MLEGGELLFEARDDGMISAPAVARENFVQQFAFARSGNRPVWNAHMLEYRIKDVSVYEDRRDELEKHEFMMGVPRGRLAVTLDVLTDALVLVGQHGVYCQSARQPGKPAMDIQLITKSISDAKDLISGVMTELKTSATTTPARTDCAASLSPIDVFRRGPGNTIVSSGSV